jgi:hypothetical protein
LTVAGNQGGVGGEHRQAVAGGDEEIVAQNHVAIAIAIRGGPKVRGIVAKHNLHQVVGIHQVGVGVTAAKVFQGFPIHYGARRGIQPPLKDRFGIGAGDRMHGIHTDAKVAAGQQLLDLIEVKQGLHQGRSR